MNIGMAFSSQMRIVWKIFGKRGRLQKLFYPRPMEYLQFTTADLNRYNNLSHSEIGNTRLPNYWETTQEEDEDILQCNHKQLTVEEIACPINMDNKEVWNTSTMMKQEIVNQEFQLSGSPSIKLVERCLRFSRENVFAFSKINKTTTFCFFCACMTEKWFVKGRLLLMGVVWIQSSN